MSDYDIEPKQKLTLQKMQQIGKNKWRIKIKEAEINLTSITIDGIVYRVLKAMTRGRYLIAI